MKNSFGRWGSTRRVRGCARLTAYGRYFFQSLPTGILLSSPHRTISQSNQAVKFEQTIKTLLKKAEESNADPYIAPLQYSTTVALSGLACSPSQLLFGHMLRTKLPALAAALEKKQPFHKVE